MQDIRARLAKGAFWVGLTRALISVIGLASTLLLARLLTPDDFGLIAVATTIIAIVSSVTELSLASALVQHKAPTDEHLHVAFTLNGARAVIIAAGLCIAAQPIADFYGDARLGPVIVTVALAGMVSGFYNPRLVLMTRDLVFWQDFALNVSQKLIGFIVAAGIAIFYRSYWALILGSAASQVVTLILSYAIRPYRPRLSMVHGRELLSFSVWLTLAQGVNTINWNLDKLVVGYVYGKAPLGIYTVGDNLAALPTREATSPIAQTLFPGFSIISGDRERLRHAYARAQGLLCAVAFPIGIGFAAAAHLIVPLALGPQWLGVTLVIQVLAVVIALQTLAATLQPLAMALGETRLLFNRDLINLVIRLPLMGLGMLLAGFPGILYGRAAAAAVGTLINMHMVRQLIGMTIYRQFSNNSRLFAASFAMLATMMAVEAGLGAYDINAWVLMMFICAAGGVGFVSTAAGLWLVAGRPRGPESEIASAVTWAIVRVLPLIPFSRSPR